MALVAAILAVPLGYALGATLNDRLTDVWFKINTHLSVIDFLRVLLPAFIFLTSVLEPHNPLI